MFKNIFIPVKTFNILYIKQNGINKFPGINTARMIHAEYFFKIKNSIKTKKEGYLKNFSSTLITSFIVFVLGLSLYNTSFKKQLVEAAEQNEGPSADNDTLKRKKNISQ